jgi:hypothetical protein
MSRATTARAASIERFERRARSQDPIRYFAVETMAALYARHRGDADTLPAYRELMKALDGVGHLGSRVLYLHPDISPPYFPPHPHKGAPIITRAFIAQRVDESGIELTRDAYLSRCWIDAASARRWLNSYGIDAPGLNAETPPKPSRAAPRAKKKATKRQRAETAIAELGPEVLDLTNTELTYRVCNHLRANGRSQVAHKTVMRAAGRAK